MKTMVYRTTVLIVFIAILLLVIGLFSTDFFHFVVEVSTIFVGIMIFIIAINSRDYSRRSILMVIGSAYLFVSMLDLAHLYLDINKEALESGLFKSLQFWIGARFIESLFILVAVIVIERIEKVSFHWMMVSSFLIALLFTILIIFEIAPSMFGEGGYGDSTRYFVVLVIIGIYVTAALFLYMSEYEKIKKIVLLVVIALKVLSLLLLLDFAITGNNSNHMGFIVGYLSYGGLYILFVANVIHTPYANIFNLFVEREKSLLEKSQKDSLTQLYNHSTTFNKIHERMRNSKEIGFGLLMIDLDNFKKVNDDHGHLIGDQVLIKFSELLLGLKENSDVVGRYGGDEFIYLLDHCSSTCLSRKTQLIRDGMLELSEFFGFHLTASLGGAVYQEGDSITEFIKKADIKLYESKANGKDQLTVWKKQLKDD